MPLGVPEEVPAAPPSLAEGLGAVVPSFEQGDLFLTNADGFAFRLSWTGDEEERPRALPAGKYVLKTYRIVRDEDDERWHVSATRPTIQAVEVQAGATTTVEIDDSIRISSKLNGDQAQMMISGDSNAGLSIYRGGKRIPIDYRILGDDDSLVASGRMRYG